MDKKVGTSHFTVQVDFSNDSGYLKTCRTKKDLDHLISVAIRGNAQQITIGIDDRPKSLPPQNRKHTGNRSRAYG